MLYETFLLRGEVILGQVHVTLRARRSSDSPRDSWDDLYRGVSELAGHVDPLDELALVLHRTVVDLSDGLPITDSSPRVIPHLGGRRYRGPDY